MTEDIIDHHSYIHSLSSCESRINGQFSLGVITERNVSPVFIRLVSFSLIFCLNSCL